jgi:4-hydroxy-2-oxoglutarate aldolase
MKTLTGILAPVVTPFDARGELALDALAANLTAHLGAGLHGVVVAGSTGEAPLLDESERRVVLERARAAVPSDRWLLGGVGAESTRQTVRRAREAAECGADAVLVVAPHYYGAAAMTDRALREHYGRVADESPVPLVLYSIPKYMHFALPPEVVAELARHENIVGIKDSSGDLALLERYLEAQSSRFAVLTGNGSTLREALLRGARGGVLAVALFAPALALDVYADPRGAAAEEAQRRLTPLAAHVVGRLGVAGVKAALDRVGLVGGPVRAPLLPLSSGELAEVDALLRGAAPAVAA